MASHSVFCFFALPPELRLEVYHIINDFNEVPMSAFKGLYQSCRQAKDEMDAECIQGIRRTIMNAWTSDNDTSLLQLPSTFAAAKVVKITVPATAIPASSTASNADLEVIHQLAHLPLDSLIVRFQHDGAHDMTELDRPNFKLHYYTYRVWKTRQHMHPAIRVHKMVFEETVIDGSDSMSGSCEPCFTKMADNEDWGVIVEEGPLGSDRHKTGPQKRITRAKWTMIKVWEKAWLANQIRSWA